MDVHCSVFTLVGLNVRYNLGISKYGFSANFTVAVCECYGSNDREYDGTTDILQLNSSDSSRQSETKSQRDVVLIH